MELTARDRRRSTLAETFTIARESRGRGRGRAGRDPARRRLGLRRGGADRALRRVGRRRRSRGSSTSSSATTRGRSTRSPTALPPGEQAARAARRRGAARPAGEARRACPSTGCSACAARARRPRGRSGSAIPTTWRGAPRRPQPRGFRRLKLKLGGRDGLDLERVQRRARGRPSCRSRCDVNEYWTLDEALELLPQMPLEYCEQPLAGRRSRTGPS